MNIVTEAELLKTKLRFTQIYGYPKWVSEVISEECK